MNVAVLALAVILMTALGAFGSLGLKKGAAAARGLLSLALNPWFILGGAMYFVSALLDIWLLKYLPYVIVLPLTALTYVWSMALAGLVLHERITKTKMFGLALVIAGLVVLVA